MTKPDRPNASSVSRYQDYRLEPKENVPAPPPPRTALGRRLRKAQQGTEQSDRLEERPVIRVNRDIGREELSTFQKGIKQGTDYLHRVSQLAQKHLSAVVKSQPGLKPKHSGKESRFWLVMDHAFRRVMLPLSGSLVFGHSGQGIVLSPDVDLSFEDRHARQLSRRHAVVTGNDGRYTVADLGTRTGVFLNDEPVDLRPSPPLQPGDRIRLGHIQFLFDRVPDELLAGPIPSQVRHVLTISPTNHRLTLTPSGSLLIGRTDLRLNYKPDIDLSQYGDLARQVSRRHAKIEWHHGIPYLEDLGSGFGTRLRGDLLPIGQSARLYPGDQIWLAGCVLAYDVAQDPAGS